MRSPAELEARLSASLRHWEEAGAAPMLLRGLARAGMRAVRAAEAGYERGYRDAMLLWVAQWGVLCDDAAARGSGPPVQEALFGAEVGRAVGDAA